MADEMAGAIALLRAKRASKQQEIEALDRAIAQIEQVMAMVEPGSVPVSTEYAGLSIGAAAKRWLTEIGRPASTREIAEALLANGVRTSSKNFTMTVYTIIREDPAIGRVGKGLRGLKDGGQVENVQGAEPSSAKLVTKK